MEPRERLPQRPTRADRERAAARADAWGLTLLNAFPILAVCLLALVRGRPDVAAAALVLAAVALGLVHALLRPRRPRLAVIPAARLREVSGRP